MIQVLITKQGDYSLSLERIKDIARKTLGFHGVVDDSSVDIAFVDRKKMDELNRKYYKDHIYEHPVFTFPESGDNKFVFPPNGKKYLGQIVINYSMATETAKKDYKSVEDVILSLVEHGCLHLAGVHHI